MNRTNHHNPGRIVVIAVLAIAIIFFIGNFIFGMNTNTPKNPETTVNTGSEICPSQYDPVCGTDGNEYINSCIAKKKNINYTPGKCEKNIVENALSGATETTETKMCTQEYNPVCGNDGNTYGNRCMAEGAGVKIVSMGSCEKISENFSGWTVSPTLPENPKTEILENIETTETASGTLSEYDASKYHIYTNEAVGYSFAFPKNTSYRGFGPQEWAIHTLGISGNFEWVEDFSSADVQIFYYKNTPANPPSSDSVTLDNGAKVYIKNNTSLPLNDTIISNIKESLQ